MRTSVKNFLLQQFWKWDTATFRTFFAASSIVYALALALQPQAFNHPGFALMKELAPAGVWAAAFALHWALLSLCLLPTLRYWVGLNTAVNLYGFAIWGSYVYLQWWSVGYFTIGTAMETVSLAFSVFTIVRHGFAARVSDLV